MIRTKHCTAAVVALFAALTCAAANADSSSDNSGDSASTPLPNASTVVSYSDFVKAITGDMIATANIPMYGGEATGTNRDGSAYSVVVPGALSDSLTEKLISNGAELNFVSFESSFDQNAGDADEGNRMPVLLNIFFNILPFLIFLIFLGFVVFQMRRGNNGYYDRAEKLQADFFARIEKLLVESKQRD